MLFKNLNVSFESQFTPSTIQDKADRYVRGLEGEWEGVDGVFSLLLFLIFFAIIALLGLEQG